MKLRDYLHLNRIKISQFARSLGYAPGYINVICNEKKLPSARLADAIKIATGGNVTFDTYDHNEQINTVVRNIKKNINDQHHDYEIRIQKCN